MSEAGREKSGRRRRARLVAQNRLQLRNGPHQGGTPRSPVLLSTYKSYSSPNEDFGSSIVLVFPYAKMSS
jgi:hypothetical protein